MAILVMGGLSLAASPALARENAYVSGYRNPPPVEEERVQEQDIPPAIYSVSPDEVKAGAGAKTLTVTGEGFDPSSVVRINGSNRYTTFIDKGHLLAYTTPNDFYRNDGGFYVTVWNANGDYSNAARVVVKGEVPATPANDNQNQNYGQTSYYPAQNNQYNPYAYPQSGGYNPGPIGYYPGQLDSADMGSGQSLAGSIILGGNTFLPSGLIQWVLAAILIVAIIVLGRKVLGNRQRYYDAPLKHA